MSEAKRINPRNFPCDKCDMSYTTNQKLKFHKMSVHDGIKLNCPHCDVKLANPDTLQKHIKKQHEGLCFFFIKSCPIFQTDPCLKSIKRGASYRYSHLTRIPDVAVLRIQ